MMGGWSETNHRVHCLLEDFYQCVTTLTPSGKMLTGHLCVCVSDSYRRGCDLDLDVLSSIKKHK